MTIKTWEQRRQELIDKGADAGYIGPMHAEIAELRKALQDYEAGGMTMTQAYKKLRDEAESLREKVLLTAQERDEANEELAQNKSEFAEHISGLNQTIDELSKECGQLAEAGMSLHAQVAELLKALQESEDCAIKAAMEYEKLKREAAMLRESNAFIAKERYDAIEDVAKLKSWA